MWCLIINLMAFGVGGIFVLVLFKSHMVDQAINFLYRVRTNPILALSQVGLGLGRGLGLRLGLGLARSSHARRYAEQIHSPCSPCAPYSPHLTHLIDRD
jgi:hypothetical protein